jgi:N-acetylglucosamine-6-phosphate deacetylase
MALALRGARILLPDGVASGQALIIERGRIGGVVDVDQIPRGAQVRDLAGGVLTPGFIDVQVNGGGGVLFNDAPSVEAIRAIGAAHRRFGTTGFLPTLISDEAPVIERAIRAVEAAIAEGAPGVLGIHLEGPLLSGRRHGIHDPARLRAADDDLIELMSSLRGGVTLVTLAPEVVDTTIIARLVAAGAVVSAGHTEATYEQVRAGLEAGVTGFTHLFNAMSPMTSRAPGVVGAALEDARAWCGLIVDGVHVHPAVLRVALCSRPVDRFMLVTDGMPPVGAEPHGFSLHGQQIEVTDGRCVDARGTLAGSVLDMATAVRNCVRMLGLDLDAAVALASASPAAFLQMSGVRGRIAPGLAADLVWLDDELNVLDTWIAGVAASGEAS